ncbi:MAG: type I restriction-modification system subunit M [Flavobacteriaceae bacterium]|nr:type I restriction-modification system subunit M [Flavobacteriaceae bacterium]
MTIKSSREEEKQALGRMIWKMAEELRGSIDGWDFKQYVLGILFYRFLSENLSNYLNKEQRNFESEFDYAQISDLEAEEARKDTIKEKGFYILPSELFQNVVQNASNQSLNEVLARVFLNIENSARGQESESDFKGLFDDIDVNSKKLGNTVIARNKKLIQILKSIKSLNFGDYAECSTDTFGDAYEYLMSMYASQAGKSGGEYFTPQEVSHLLVEMVMHGNNKLNKVYDPACGSGSLLLKFIKILGENKNKIEFYGQEKNLTTYNLCRINMILHNINYDKFDIAHGDTLINPNENHQEGSFDAIVSNPPFSLKWEGKDNPILINDSRFSDAGVLAPKDKADLAFTMHILSRLHTTGTAAIIHHPGALYRVNAEQKIRKYLLDNNYVHSVIQLPKDLFFGTPMATCIVVLKKSKEDNKVHFIDAYSEFKKSGNKNKLSDNNRKKIMDAYIKRNDIPYFSSLVDKKIIEENNYSIKISTYVQEEDTSEVVDIKELNKEIANIV